MSEISIERTEYPELKECEIGEPLLLRGTVSAIDGDTLTIEVETAAYDESAAEEESPAPPVKSNPVSKIGVPRMSKKAYV